jgi:hypothetical protein
MRREFMISEEDQECLAGTGLDWEAIMEAKTMWLILRRFPIPAGYNTAAADAALRLPPSYPDDQIDMVYFFPNLALASGRPINRLTPLILEGKQYQQWSRHRTAANPWRPGVDNLCTHLLQVKNWLERELGKTI